MDEVLVYGTGKRVLGYTLLVAEPFAFHGMPTGWAILIFTALTGVDVMILKSRMQGF